jgi:hypothetical protein
MIDIPPVVWRIEPNNHCEVAKELAPSCYPGKLLSQQFAANCLRPSQDGEGTEEVGDREARALRGRNDLKREARQE